MPRLARFTTMPGSLCSGRPRSAPGSASSRSRRCLFPEVAVSLQELESAVSQLPADELTAFARWFEEYLADAWDRRIEEDIKAGRLDEAGRRADADFEAGRCKPL
jgi:hypothetical protein